MRNQALTLLESLPREESRNASAVAVPERPPSPGGAVRGQVRQDSGRSIRRILVPTDFSPGSARAVEYAAGLAGASEAVLTLLHVIDINPPAASRHFGTAEDLMRQIRATGEAELARLKKSLEESHCRVQTHLVEGLPCEAILEHSSGFDLLVISEPRPDPGWKFFSRHTARRVIDQAECPVQIVPGPAPAFPFFKV